jgi:hypothetical protein
MRRRDFLARGGGLVVATGAAALVPFDGVLPFEGLDRDRGVDGSLRKCISFGGPGPLREVGHPDDYRLWGNRRYVLESNTTWVKLWISWFDLQQELGAPPRSRADCWRHLNTAPNREVWLRRLDRQVKGAKDDGRGVIVTLFHTFPHWSSGASGPDPIDPRKPAEQKIPSDLSPDGPWGWFIAHLCARYRKGAGRNPIGPHEPEPGADPTDYDPRAGNPLGGWIDALEICNEPNLLFWPQDEVVGAVAQMVRTAEQISYQSRGPAIVAPATSDFPDQNHEDERGLLAMGWRSFSEQLHRQLADFAPRVPVHWSQHNFNDVKRPVQPSRVEEVVALLRRGWATQNRPLWLTEGGYNLDFDEEIGAARKRQARLIERNYSRVLESDAVYMWTQHTISDKQGNEFKSGLRDDFVAGSGPGAPRPAWYLWKRLPGSRVV